MRTSRILTLGIVAVIAGAALLWRTRLPLVPVIPPPPALAVDIPQDRIDIKDAVARTGDVVTSKDLPNNYYIGVDRKRYVFTTNQVYDTWYPKEAPKKTIGRAMLELLPLARNVTSRPGMRILRFETDPAYYVVSHGGTLHAASEKLLTRWYGRQWRERLDTTPEYYRADYRIGELIKSARDYSPSQEYKKSKTISIDLGIIGNVSGEP